MNNNINQNILKAVLDSLININDINAQTSNTINNFTENNINSKPQSEPQSESSSQNISKPKTNRCLECKKKVGYLGFDCKCKGYFCSSHRYPEKHNCTYDHKTDHINKLRADNPQIMAEKVQKI